LRRLNWLFPLALACTRHGEVTPTAPDKAPSTVAAPLGVPGPPLPSVSAPRESRAPADAPTPASSAPPPQLPEIPEDMLPVPGGTFVMGAEGEGEEDERPAHSVTLKGFLLDRTEVTNQAYLACVRASACKPYQPVAASFGGEEGAFRGPAQPAVGVSWFEAEAYCAFRGKRLPSEAEWERAARGDDGRRYAWGNQAPDPLTLACYGRNPKAKGGATMPVGSYPKGEGPYGHLDLTGNVWEWTADVYDPYAYRRPRAAEGIPGSCAEVLATQDELRRAGKQGFTGKNPIPTTCERVLRGGAFNYRADGLRVSNRVHHPPEWHILVAGFRCARDL
jgi:formylglycine-generating enzyme required for sulfatase activity